MATAILSDLVQEARRLLEGARASDVLVRAVGGIAIPLHANGDVHPAFARPYRDIDLVTKARGTRDVSRFLVEMGYSPNERFNAMNGSRRLVFYDVEHERQLDVFVGQFEMCHSIPIADRLALDERTVPLAELLLTKLQVVHLNEKDLDDIWAILHEHEVAEHDDDAVNAAYVASLLAGDWGFWRTTRETIETAQTRLASSGAPAADRKVIEDRLARLWERIEAEPKNLRWRTRARLGDRAKWYDEPEEIAHGVGR